MESRLLTVNTVDLKVVGLSGTGSRLWSSDAAVVRSAGVS